MRDGNTWDNNYTKDYSRLKQVCEFYGIEYVETDAHRAEYDVLKTRLVAEKMIKKLGIKKCIEITEAYVHGKGYGYKAKKNYIGAYEKVAFAKEVIKAEETICPTGTKGKEGVKW